MAGWASRQLHLIVDPVFPAQGSDGVRDHPLMAIGVPDVPARLVFEPEGRAPRATGIPEEAEAPISLVIPRATMRGATARGAASCCIEPVEVGGRPRLLMLTCATAEPLRVNGHAAPRVCLLEEGDQILLSDDTLLHLTVYNRPPIGPADDEVIGRECLLCRTRLLKGSTVYTCACGALFHFHFSQNGAEEPLECAKLIPECTRCLQSIVLTEGFAHVPDPR